MNNARYAHEKNLTVHLAARVLKLTFSRGMVAIN